MLKLLICVLFAASLNLLGDDHGSTEKKVFEAYFTKIKPGKVHRFREIAHKYWFPTDQAVKRLAVPIELTTGHWDHIVLFYRTEGFKKLNHTDKVSLKWIKNANKNLGESERVKLHKEFSDLIIDQKTQLFTLVGNLPVLSPEYYNLDGQYSPVYSYFTKFKPGSNLKAFEMMDEIAEMSGESPIVFRSISGEIDQISIWPVSDGFSRVHKGLSNEMKEFIESPLGKSFFDLVEDLGLQIGSVRWQWK